MRELRIVKRHRIIKDLTVVSESGPVSCVVLDISDKGLLAHLAKPSNLPEVVTLKLPDGTERFARRCWRQDTDIGFEFLAIPGVDLHI